MLKTLLYIGIGGAGGSMARYLLSRYITNTLEDNYPWATWVVNCTGSLLLGLIIGLAIRFELSIQQGWIMLLTVGFCGSFTTFSTFAYEVLQAGNQQGLLQALLMAAFSLIAGILCCYIGLQMATTH